ncbi:MAG: hypothetical protein ACJ766_02995 [Thermoleophilaceae bacterium]
MPRLPAGYAGHRDRVDGLPDPDLHGWRIDLVRLATVTPASFDMKKAPVARGYFVDDYEGLDHGGSTFKVFFVQTHNGDTGTNPTDVYAADATP